MASSVSNIANIAVIVGILSGLTGTVAYFVAVWNVKPEAASRRGMAIMFFSPSMLSERGQIARRVALVNLLVFLVMWFVALVGRLVADTGS
jgi:hypothetical protein